MRALCWILLAVVLVVCIVAASLWVIFIYDDVDWPTHNPYDTDGQWYKGQIHCHSTNSQDGRMTPSQAMAQYSSLGFDFIAITDHWQLTAVSGEGIFVLGQEYGKGSTESGGNYRPHMNGLNISSVPSNDDSYQSRINSMAAQGGIVILNHPTTFPFYYSRGTMLNLVNYAGIEIYNANAPDGVITRTWDALLTQGKMIWGFAGDDAHGVEKTGRGWIVVRFSGALETANVINAIKQGSFYSSQGPAIDDISYSGSSFRVLSEGAESISFYGIGGKVLKTVSGGDAEFDTSEIFGYVRAEVSKNGKVAWSQPVFLGSGNGPTSASITEKMEFGLREAQLELVAVFQRSQPLSI